MVCTMRIYSKKRIQDAVNIKPERHYLNENMYIKRNMTCIGG